MPISKNCKKVFAERGKNRNKTHRKVGQITRVKEYETNRYDDIIAKMASKYNIPISLIKAVIKAESNFNWRAISPRGAMGLMQLMPGTARKMGINDPYEPRQNIMAGVKYLRYLANQFKGDMVKVVAAYNAGPQAVKKYNGNIPPFRETQRYVRKVIRNYFQYKKRGHGGVIKIN